MKNVKYLIATNVNFQIKIQNVHNVKKIIIYQMTELVKVVIKSLLVMVMDIALIVLKICGVITWSWLIVIPLIIVIAAIPWILRIAFIYWLNK